MDVLDWYNPNEWVALNSPNLVRLIESGRQELAPLRRWAEGISRYYLLRGLAPCIGASLARTLDSAGYREVCCEWFACPTDQTAIANMLMYYDEIREQYRELGVMTAEEIDLDQRRLAALPLADLPPAWGMYCVTCVA